MPDLTPERLAEIKALQSSGVFVTHLCRSCNYAERVYTEGPTAHQEAIRDLLATLEAERTLRREQQQAFIEAMHASEGMHEKELATLRAQMAEARKDERKRIVSKMLHRHEEMIANSPQENMHAYLLFDEALLIERAGELPPADLTAEELLP